MDQAIGQLPGDAVNPADALADRSANGATDPATLAPVLEAGVPIIYTPSVLRATVDGAGRFGALVISMCALTVLIIAGALDPSPSGVGTHQEMGFPGCAWMSVSGIPCPTCGMTTSFSHFAHGNWVASFYVQPMGFVLALLTGTIFWASLYIALTARPIHRLTKQLPMVWVISAGMFFGIMAWGWKIFIHLHHMDGWR